MLNFWFASPSYEDRIIYIKMRKPDKQIFDYALKKIRRSGDEIVFIDDRKANVGGARAAGMNSILFTGLSQLKEDLLKLGVKIL